MDVTSVDRRDSRPHDDQITVICAALIAYHGDNSYIFADRQMGAAIDTSLAIWLSVVQRLRM